MEKEECDSRFKFGQIRVLYRAAIFYCILNAIAFIMGMHECCSTVISTKQLPAEWTPIIISHVTQTRYTPVLHNREKLKHIYQLQCTELKI